MNRQSGLHLSPLYRPPGKASLGVELDQERGRFRFYGHSYPENALEFFMPLLDWIGVFVDLETRPLEVILEVDYFNTSSTKYLFQIMEKVREYRSMGHPVDIAFYYSRDMEDVLLAWKELMDELDLPFRAIPRCVL